MKKLFLLAATALVGFSANAQNALPAGGGSLKQAIPAHQIRNTPPPVAGKSTAANGRWYDHMGTVDIFNGGVMSTSLMPIWFDSTVMQNFTSGLSNINFISAGQIIDPIHYDLFNDANIFTDPNTLFIQMTDQYVVDSVSISCAYVNNANRSASIVDTLIFSVAPSTYSYYWATSATGDPDDAWTNGYVPVNGDTVRGFTILNVDSVNRAGANPGVTMWKVPVDASFRQDDSAGFVDIQTFDFKTPADVTIPAGQGIAVTVTFKTGDVVVVPNVDTFSEYHNFSLFEGEALGAGQKMPYYYYTQHDRNMSNLMFSFDTSNYFPSVFIEGWNAISFRQEFHAIAAHVKCTSCTTLGVAETKGKITTYDAYPNPANNEVNIIFTVAQTGKANVTVTNSVGQVMNTTSVNAVAGEGNTTKIATENLATGVYFYTIEANGQRSTSRFVVSH